MHILFGKCKPKLKPQTKFKDLSTFRQAIELKSFGRKIKQTK